LTRAVAALLGLEVEAYKTALTDLEHTVAHAQPTREIRKTFAAHTANRYHEQLKFAGREKSREILRRYLSANAIFSTREGYPWVKIQYLDFADPNAQAWLRAVADLHGFDADLFQDFV